MRIWVADLLSSPLSPHSGVHAQQVRPAAVSPVHNAGMAPYMAVDRRGADVNSHEKAEKCAGMPQARPNMCRTDLWLPLVIRDTGLRMVMRAQPPSAGTRPTKKNSRVSSSPVLAELRCCPSVWLAECVASAHELRLLGRGPGRPRVRIFEHALLKGAQNAQAIRKVREGICVSMCSAAGAQASTDACHVR